MSFTNRINYSLNITGGNLIVGGSSSIGNMSASSAAIQNLTSTNITTNSLVGTSASLSGVLSVPSATVPQLIVTNASASSFVGSNANLSGTITTGSLRISGNVSAPTVGNLTVSGLFSGKVYRTNMGQLDSAPNTFYINSRGDTDQYGAINLMVNNSSGIYINEFGNVGINNVSPLAPLHFANVNASRKIVLWTDQNNDHQYFGLGTNADAFRLQVNNPTSDFVFYTATSSTASNELMRIKGTGNVGIGTNNPARNLHLHKSSASQDVRLVLTDGTTTNADERGLHLIKNTVQNAFLYNYEPGFLQFATNNTPIMTLTTNGNVGIGTTTANGHLQFSNSTVNRKIVLWDTPNNDHQFYGFGVNSYVLRYQVDTSLASHVFYAGTSTTTSTELMRIGGNGNVGIGNNSPNFTLDVNGTFDVSNANGVLIFNSAGNVGIGTTAPSYKLTVFNGENQNTSMLIASGNETNNSSLYLGTPLFGNLSGAQKTAIIAQALNSWSRSNLHFCLNSDGTSNGAEQSATLAHSRMMITNTGNVGIGTTSPSVTLDVNGRLRVASTSGALINNVNFTNYRSPFRTGATTSAFSNVAIYIGNTQNLTTVFDSSTGSNTFPDSYTKENATFTHNLNLTGTQHINLTLTGGGGYQNGTYYALSSYTANSFTVCFYRLIASNVAANIGARQFNYTITHYS